MQEALGVATQDAASLEAEQNQREVEEDLDLKAASRQRITAESVERNSSRLLRALRRYEERPDLSSIREARSNLPVGQHSAQIVEAVENNIYSIVVGTTGSIMTTQIPRLTLNNAINAGKVASCNIICTQPRRVAAISAAWRIAHERAQILWDHIGYQVRFDKRAPKYDGSVTLCTTGVL